MTAVKGAKRGSHKQRKPNIQKDSASSISTVKILYGLSEGEIEGLVNGAASIYLDGTPLVDETGKENYPDVRWEFRSGTNDQEYIKGFPDVTNERPVNVELKSSAPWVRAITDTQLSAVRVRLKWGRVAQTSDNGDVSGYKIDYAIDVKTDDGAYQTMLEATLNDKVSANYQRTHRIDLPRANKGWQIRVRRLTENSDSDLIQDKMYVDAIAEVIDAKLNYPNTALLGIEYNGEMFSSIAKLGVELKGRRILVPVNYNPKTRSYTGMWNGRFKEAYSNNPAWVFYDLCTQWRYGLGERFDASMIDKWSLYSLGQYCDEMVDDGQGGLEPRFACNVYLQKQADAYQVLSNIAGVFRALAYWDGQQIVIDADVPKDPVYTFTHANIVGGMPDYTGTRHRDRHTIVKVAYSNPDNNYETEYEFVRDEQAMAKYGVRVCDMSAFACTSRGQAQRAGLAILKSEQLETQKVSFATGLEGFIPRVGDVIQLADSQFAARAQSGRISDVSSKQYVITVDRDVTASAGDTLVVNGGNGKVQKRRIRSVSGRKITVSSAFDSAESQNIWAIETDDLKLMLFRVMSITQNDDMTFTITAIQHDPNKFIGIDTGADVKPDLPTHNTYLPSNNTVLEPPAYVNITSSSRVVQAQTVTTMTITWAQVEGATEYDVEWRRNDGTWQRLPRAESNSVDVSGVYAGLYQARVRAVSAFGLMSSATQSPVIEIKSKDTKPSKLPQLMTTSLLFGIGLTWTFGDNTGDTDYTEIQVAERPDVNVSVLGTYSYPTNYTAVQGLSANQILYFRARIVDKLGFSSDWTAWVEGMADAEADKVLKLLWGQIQKTQLHKDLVKSIDKIDVNELNISDETQARIDAIAEQNAQLLAERDARIKADIAQDKARIAQIKALKDGITKDVKELKDADSSLLSQITNYKASTDSKLAVAQESIQTLSNEQTSIASKLDGVYAQVNPVMAGDTGINAGDDTIHVGVWSETTARIEGDLALGTRIDNVTANWGNNLAYVQQQTKSLVDATQSLATDVKILAAAQSGNVSLIMDEYYTKTTTDEVIARNIEQFKTEYVLPELNQKASASALDYTQSQVENLGNTLNVTSSKLDGVYAQLNPIMAGATDTNAGDSNIKVGVWSETTARIEGDLALAQRTDVIETQVDDTKAAIRTEQKARIQDDKALALRLDNLAVQINDNQALITSMSKTYADEQTAIAQNVETLQTSMRDVEYETQINTASIREQKRSINGLYAQYTLNIDVNGRIYGFGLAGDSKMGEFAVRADRFYIAPPWGDEKGEPPFIVRSTPENVNGTIVQPGVYIRNASIQNASIDTLQIRGQAVSVSAAVHQSFNDHTLFANSNSSGRTASVYLDNGGAPVSVELYCYGWLSVDDGDIDVRIYANGSVIAHHRFTLKLWQISSVFKAIYHGGWGGTNIYAVISCSGSKRLYMTGYMVSATSLKR